MTVRVRLEYTSYPHVGAHAGYFQFARHLDRGRFDVDLRGTTDSDAELPLWLRTLRLMLRRRLKRGPAPWYKVSNVGAELRILPSIVAGRVDIVHFLDGEHSGSLVPKFVRRTGLGRTKTVATFHQPPSIAKTVVDCKMLKWFDRIVLVSPSQVPFFAQYVPRDRLQVLLHGVDTAFFRPAIVARRETRLRCITVGHWLRDIEAFKEVATALEGDADVSFDVVTNRSLGLEALSNVRVHKNIDDVALAELYRSADVLFLPLLDSTANNALLEGIASGLAIVTTDMESTRAYLPDGGAIFVAQADRGGLVDALRHLRANVQFRLDLGGQARLRAEQLSWSNMVSQYEAFYEDLVAQGRASARGVPAPKGAER